MTKNYGLAGFHGQSPAPLSDFARGACFNDQDRSHYSSLVLYVSQRSLPWRPILATYHGYQSAGPSW